MDAPQVDTKETNPKDAIGAKKLPMGLVPDIITAEAALAFTEGALKYGRFNWRVAGVRSSIYHDAMRRHLAKWQNGENRDPVTNVHHLASVIACAGIIMDAAICGKLNDDRPPVAPLAQHIDNLSTLVPQLQEIFKDCNPHQHSCLDKPEEVMPIIEEHEGKKIAACPAGYYYDPESETCKLDIIVKA